MPGASGWGFSFAPPLPQTLTAPPLPVFSLEQRVEALASVWAPRTSSSLIIHGVGGHYGVGRLLLFMRRRGLLPEGAPERVLKYS